MLPSKRRKKIFLIIILTLIISILLILGIWYLSKKARGNDNELKSDIYPDNIYYIAFYYDNDLEYYLIDPLDQNFNSLNYDIHSFYPIKDTLFNNNYLMLYSDSINILSYNKDSNNFILKEINSYYNQDNNIFLTPDYFLILDKEGTLIKEDYDKEEETKVFANIIGKFLVVDKSYIYFIVPEGLMQLNIDNNERKIVLNSKETLITLHKKVNNYIFLDDEESIIIYDINTGKETYLEIDPKQVLDFSDNYIIYNNEDSIYAYDITLKDTIKLDLNNVANMYYISDNNYFLKTKDSINIYNIESQKITKTLKQDYIQIVGVR